MFLKLFYGKDDHFSHLMCCSMNFNTDFCDQHHNQDTEKIPLCYSSIYAPVSNTAEAEFKWFCEDPQDLLEPTPKRDILFITGDWNTKVGSQEIPGVMFGLGVQNEAGQRLTEFCKENTLVIANTLFQQHKKRLYTWASPDGQHWNQIDFLQPKMEKLYTVNKNKTGSWLWLRSENLCLQIQT